MSGIMILTLLTVWQEGTVGPDLPRPEARPLPSFPERPAPAPATAETRAPSRPDAVLRWNEVTLQAVRAARTSPPQAARHLALVHAAIYDSVNAVYQTHQPYRVSLRLPAPIDPTTVTAIAAHRVLLELYPEQVERFDTALDETLSGVKDSDQRKRAVAIGQQVAEKILTLRAGDGATRKVSFAGSLEVGLWRPTPPKNAPALLPQWASVKPFAISEVSHFRPSPPPPLTSEEYAQDFNEVKRLGERRSRTRSANETLIALFWADDAGTVTPPGHWNVIAGKVALDQRNSLPENARLFALLNFALADAAICCWECKYRHRVWRPITAIHQADRDGNPDTEPDTSWAPLLNTPPFPSYTSGHSTFSGAAAAMLAQFYGTDKITFKVGSDGLPGHVRSFSSFSAAASEAGRSRIYGGIHYEFDNRAGLEVGRKLAEEIYRTTLTEERLEKTTSRRKMSP